MDGALLIATIVLLGIAVWFFVRSRRLEASEKALREEKQRLERGLLDLEEQRTTLAQRLSTVTAANETPLSWYRFASATSRGSYAMTYGQWLHETTTTKRSEPKSASEWVLSSVPGRLNAGHTAPISSGIGRDLSRRARRARDRRDE